MASAQEAVAIEELSTESESPILEETVIAPADETVETVQPIDQDEEPEDFFAEDEGKIGEDHDLNPAGSPFPDDEEAPPPAPAGKSIETAEVDEEDDEDY